MPEMPEVQHFTDYFNHRCLNKKIVSVSVKTALLLKQTTSKKLKQALIGKKFYRAHRRGKFMIVNIIRDTHKLIFHFGMTGSLLYRKPDELPKKETQYAKLIIEFSNGSVLLWINKRKFGRIYLVTNSDMIPTLRTMGPEAVSVSTKKFQELLETHERKNIKSFLMDQSIIAGIGNEYSNEILYQTGIDPHRSVNLLNKKDQTKLLQTIKRILKKASTLHLAHGTYRIQDIDYPKSWLLAHTYDLTCPKGGNFVKKTIAGRTAIYSPLYQK